MGIVVDITLTCFTEILHGGKFLESKGRKAEILLIEQ